MRLLTRSDFDGLACGAVLKLLGVIDSWCFVHPKDVQDGKVDVSQDDVLANIPFAKGCGMWFDHHSSEFSDSGRDRVVPGESRIAPSCARVIYDYYDGAAKLPQLLELVEAADKVDSGSLTLDEVKNPSGWVLLGFIMDPRTGLGRFRNFTISNLELMVRLLDACAEMTIEEILALPDVKERVDLFFSETERFREMLYERSKTEQNVIVTDLRGVQEIHAGNRFLIYSLFPDQNVSVWIVDGRAKQNVSIAVGYSILTRTCKSDVGALMKRFGGGGHRAVGTCQVPYAEADASVAAIVDALISGDK